MHFSRHVRSEMEAWLYLLLLGTFSASSEFVVELPKFGEPIINVTVPVGREAILECIVDGLTTYKVAWLRVDTQTILTIHSHVITKNHRIGVSHSDHRTWYLHIKEVRESDRGWYMCQINTDPMKSQVGFLDVVVPPDILDYPTSTDMVVREGVNVTLRCAASGSPAPNITWKRETGENISLGVMKDGNFTSVKVGSVEGPVLNLTKVAREHMGPYLCIASNGVPPSVSKRIMLIINFPPNIWIQNQLIGAYEGQELTLECHSDSYPKSINYWTKGEVIPPGAKYETKMVNNAFRVHMTLTISSVGPSDYGTYKCISRNSLGETDGSIKVYPIEYKGRRTTSRPGVKIIKRKQSARRGSKDFKNGTKTSNTTMLTDYDEEYFSEIDEDYNAIDAASVLIQNLTLLILATITSIVT